MAGDVFATIDKLAVDDLNERSFGALVDRIARAINAGELSSKADPMEIAQFVSGQAVALSVMARTGADRAQLQKFADNALEVLDKWKVPSVRARSKT